MVLKENGRKGISMRQNDTINTNIQFVCIAREGTENSFFSFRFQVLNARKK